MPPARRRCPTRAREIAFAAATLGRTCSPAVLTKVADTTGEVARAAIAELIKRHVLEELPDGELRFVHDKLREQAYAELSDTRAPPLPPARRRRARGHARRRLRRARAPSRAGRRPAARGRLPREGRRSRARDRRVRRGAHAAASACSRSRSTRPAERRARWKRQLGEACFALGDLATAPTHLEESLDQLGRRCRRRKLGWTARGRGGHRAADVVAHASRRRAPRTRPTRTSSRPRSRPRA